MNCFYQAGEFWTVAFGGEAAHLRDARGLQLLAQLLGRPGRETHVLDLTGGPRAGSASSESVLDDMGRRAFRGRVADLEAELEEADRFGDIGRSALTHAELDAVVEELARATGLGGRDRRATSDSERARVAATRAIRSAMRHVSEVLPPLGRHLQHSVKTGTFCSYAPDPTRRIEWQLVAPATEDVPNAAVPPRLAVELDASASFVGRSGEREMLERAGRAVVDGRPHIALVAGEAGIGKTRLVAEFAVSASRDGSLVGYGRCDEDLAHPFGPFTQALDHLVESAPTPALERHFAHHGIQVAAVAPALRTRLTHDDSPPTARGSRAQLFYVVASLLRDLSEARPVILVLDDMHWADGASLALFRHLAAADVGRTLLVGTYRDNALRRSHPLIGALAALRRHAGVTRIVLAGLSVEEVHALAVDVGVEVGDDLHRRTGGNPFFVTELLHDMRDRHGGTPAAVSDTVLDRLERLPAPAPRLLRLAAILGQEFRLDVLTGMAGVRPETTLRAMEHGEGSGLVSEVPGAVATFRFVHALVRDALYQDLSAARRGQMHLKAAETLERISPTDLRAIAHHFGAAPMPEAAEQAAIFGLRATEQALDAFAYEDAVALGRSGVAIAESYLASNPSLQGRLLVALGRAEIGDGRPDAGKASLRRAHAIARDIESPLLLADVALAFGSLSIATTATEIAEPVALLREAIAAQRAEDGTLRVRLLCALVRWLSFVAPRAERLELEHEALSMARRIGDDSLIADALVAALYNRCGPDDAADQRALAEELEARSTGVDEEKRLVAVLYRAFSALQQGRHADAAVAEDEFLAASKTRSQPFFVLYSIAILGRRACVSGDFATAERLATSMGPAAARAGWDNTVPIDMQADQLWAAWYVQGHFEDLASLVSDRPAPDDSLAFARRLVVAAELGRPMPSPDDLRRIDALIADDQTPGWWYLTPLLVHSCARLGDRDQAEVLYQKLLRWADLDIVGEVQSFHGSVQHHLGVVALTMGRGPAAVGHLTAALARHQAAGSPPWVKLTTAALARAYRCRAEPGDDELADTLEQAAAVKAS